MPAVLRQTALRLAAVAAGLECACLLVLTLVALVPLSSLDGGRALDVLGFATAAWMMAAIGLRLWMLAANPGRAEVDGDRDRSPADRGQQVEHAQPGLPTRHSAKDRLP